MDWAEGTMAKMQPRARWQGWFPSHLGLPLACACTGSAPTCLCSSHLLGHKALPPHPAPLVTGWREVASLRKKLEELRELRDLVRQLGRGGGKGPLKKAPEQVGGVGWGSGARVRCA